MYPLFILEWCVLGLPQFLALDFPTSSTSPEPFKSIDIPFRYLQQLSGELNPAYLPSAPQQPDDPSSWLQSFFVMHPDLDQTARRAWRSKQTYISHNSIHRDSSYSKVSKSSGIPDLSQKHLTEIDLEINLKFSSIRERHPKDSKDELQFLHYRLGKGFGLGCHRASGIRWDS